MKGLKSVNVNEMQENFFKKNGLSTKCNEKVSTTREALDSQDILDIFKNQHYIRQILRKKISDPITIECDVLSEKNLCKQSLESLKEIFLRDCQLDQPMENCVIYVQTFTPPGQFTAMKVGVKDEKGDIIAMLFSNTLQQGESLELMDKMYPIGTKMAIKNPYMRLVQTGYVLWNDNPTNIEIVKKKQVIPDSQDETKQLNSALRFKENGNSEYSHGRYLEAIELYNLAILTIERNQKAHDENMKEHLTVINSNISQCYLNLNSFQKSLNYSQKALSFNPMHMKSLNRLSQSLQGLNDFRKSLEVQEKLDENLKNKKTIQVLKQLIKRQEQGYTMLDILHWKDIDNHCNFIGPIKIGRTKNMGRGIFATRDIDKNEIVLVDKIVRYIPPPNAESNTRLLHQLQYFEKGKVTEDNSVRMKAYLTQQIISDVILRKRISYLYKGEEVEEDAKTLKNQNEEGNIKLNKLIPDMSLFKYNYYSEEDEKNIFLNAFEVHKAIQFNCFQSDYSGKRSINLLPLFSYFNYSRKQENITYLKKGEYYVVYTLEPIKQNQELFVDYLKDITLSEEVRRAKLKHFWNITE